MKGLDGLDHFLATLPANMERNVLRGALKAGADVIADGARENCRSEEVRADIKTSASSRETGVVTAKVEVKGPNAYKGPWLEHGTDPHFISVDDEQSGGMTVRKINRETKKGSLVIGGHFVGRTVHHPGAKPYPFMRPAADQRETAAIEAIGNHIAGKMTKAGLVTPAPEEPDE